jgi:phthalate 4,5-cis-dihydrodiol dehydrogenase
MALEHGKHVVVEKPMAISVAEAEAMVQAADKNRVHLLAGHTMSYSLPIRAMRRIIQSGRLGALRAIHVLAYTDWMLRPRSPDELDPNQGGGVPYRQGPHQIDTVRVLGGGRLRSVRGMTGQWFEERPIAGYYSAYLEFEDGTPCTIVHNGYGYFTTGELIPQSAARALESVAGHVVTRSALRRGVRDEESDKQDLRIGGAAGRGVARSRPLPTWSPGDLGIVIVSCERGDIRHSPTGLFVYDDDGVHDIDLSSLQGAGQRREELEELYSGVVLGRPVYHDGEWGLATLEACLAVVESAKSRAEVLLAHQVAMPAAYDDELEIDYLRAN